jgi:hypothetical protein
MGEYATAGIPFYWLVWITDNRVASIDVHVLDHAIGASRLLRTLAPEDEVSVLEVPVRIKVPWSQLSALVRQRRLPAFLYVIRHPQESC